MACSKMLLWGLGLGAACASLSPIGDARPMITSDNALLSWWAGGPAYVLASAGGVRLNVRGVYTYQSDSSLRDLRALGWHGAQCNVSAWELCRSGVGRVFPFDSPRVSDTPSSMVAGWRALGCVNSAAKTLVHQGVYDLSACDVLDESVDVVYARGMVFYSSTQLPMWEYWLLVLLSIVLVRGLSHNLQTVWRPEEHPDLLPQWPVLVVSAAVLGLTLLGGDSMYVTPSDQLFFWASALYVGLYLAYHTWRWARRAQDQPVYNMIAGALQLVAVRLYTGAQTPYNPVMFSMIGARIWTKLLHPSTVNQATLLLDGLYMSLCAELAFPYPGEMLVALCCVAYVAGGLLSGA